jgi:hypothetical protein
VSAELVAIHLETGFVFDMTGRMLRNTNPDRGAPPRLRLARSAHGTVVSIGHDVGEATARAIEALAADEQQPLRDRDSVPVHADEYVELLGAEAPVVERRSGLSYCFPPDFSYEDDVALVTSDMPAAERARLGMAPERVPPEPLVALGFSTVGKVWEPWCLALHEGEIASVAETVRIGPRGAEVGVNTVPTLRARGYAAAATTGWASLQSLRGRTLFYSTAVTNLSSRRVTERLRLFFISNTFSIT